MEGLFPWVVTYCAHASSFCVALPDYQVRTGEDCTRPAFSQQSFTKRILAGLFLCIPGSPCSKLSRTSRRL
jgi:hypothetical protein